MRIFIVGGTGLLGSKAAEIMINDGHDVFALSLMVHDVKLKLPHQLQIHYGDINVMTDETLGELLKSMDATVFAAGVDERVDFKPPVEKAYESYNIKPLDKLLRVSKRYGVKKCVVLGSYFSYFAKEWPKLKLGIYHPYIKNRLLQETLAFSYNDDNFHTVVLELPYIFGIQVGRRPVWSKFVDLWDKPKIIFFPKGGTTMMTLTQVGYAIYHAILFGKPQTAYPLGYKNMTWRELITIVQKGMNQHKKIMTVPNFIAFFGFLHLKKSYEKKGFEPGLNPLKFLRLMSRKAYIDPKLSDDLRIPDDDITSAIIESIAYAYEIKMKSLDVVDMKVR